MTPNRPGEPANPPQHILDESRLPPGGDTDPGEFKHKPTGADTAPAHDVADPHPSDDGDYHRIPHPGGSHPVNEDRDIGPNPAVHDGSPPPRPRNAETT